MARKKKEYRFKNSIEIEEYVDGRFGAKGKKREEKKKVTPEQVKRQNQLNKAKNCRRRIKNNFEEDDYYWTLTFKKEQRPETLDEAKKIWTKLQRKLRDEYKRQKKKFKWIISIEKGKRGAIHFHLITNRIEDGDRFMKKLWTYGSIYLRLLYDNGDYKALADYMTKAAGDGEESYYSHSRNLPIPEPRVKRLKGEWKDIEPYKGYYIDKESIVEGINPVTGYKYRHYTMIRINRRI